MTFQILKVASMKMTAFWNIAPPIVFPTYLWWWSGIRLVLWVDDDDDDDGHVDGMRLRLWTAVTNGPIVHLPSDTWSWRTTVECYRQEKTSDSSTRSLWQSYQQSHLLAKQVKLAKTMMTCLAKYLSHTSKGSLTCSNSLKNGSDGFTSPPKKFVLRIDS
jgi:hypothetical protein